MQAQIERRLRNQRAEDLRRLADQGERRGVRILVDHRTGQHVATSATDATKCYHVDVERGCTCKGYAYWGRCQHHSLLLAELGQIADTDEVDAGAVVVDLIWSDEPVEVSMRPLEAQYLRARTPHPRLPAGQLAPVA